MALTVGQLRDILKDSSIQDDLPVTFVHAINYRQVADTAFGTSIIERDTNSHAPATGRVIEKDEELLKGHREKVFAFYDR